jgi:transposase
MSKYEKVSHVGLDNHKNFSRITARDERNQVVFRQRLEHADRAALRRELRCFPAGTPVVLEASFGWSWMVDELSDAGLQPHLANCRKVAAWRTARGLAKNNKLDADLLGELWLQRDPKLWWEVWLAPQEVRDWREILRCRMSLVAMQTGLKNRIHATLHRHGILHGFSDLFGARGRAFLGALAKAEEPLREATRMTLGVYLQMLGMLRRRIAELTRRVRRMVVRNKQAELWRSLPGVGWILAYTIQAEVGDGHRFRGGRGLCRYALLAPVADDSGDEDKSGAAPVGRHVGWDGRLTLKWAFIEAARGAVRKRSGAFLEVFNCRTDGGKRERNRGYIAVARKLALVGLSCVRAGRRYDSSCPPPRPGSRAAQEQQGEDKAKSEQSSDKRKSEQSYDKRKPGQPKHHPEEKPHEPVTRQPRPRKRPARTSRPGMGQPEDPMVVAPARR